MIKVNSGPTIRFFLHQRAPKGGILLLSKMLPLVLPLSIIAALLGLPAAAYAQSDWQATYWNNTTLAGDPVLTRSEPAINHNWGIGSPDPRVSSDTFSARWTRIEQLEEGAYRFTATVDDGLRVWINGVQIIDDWRIGSVRTLTANVYVTAGRYEIRVEYFEATGVASVTFEQTLRSRRTPVAALPTSTPSPTPTPNPIENPNLGTISWRGEYYNNTTLAGTPALIRGDNNIDFNWGTGSPAPGIIGSDTFSVRWTRTLNLELGRYRFAVTADDGVRLYIDNRLLIDEWQDQAATTYTVEVAVTDSTTAVRMEYYENRDRATARLSYAKILSSSTPTQAAGRSANRGNWRGEYFDNVNLSGPPLIERTDPAIDFDWGSGSPAPNELGVDRFSIRWTGTLTLTPGRYRFTMTVDDGGRLRINGETVIDKFIVQSAHEYSAEVNLPSGRATVVMEYFEDTGQAVARLSWSRASGAAAASNPPTAQPAPTQLPSDQPIAAISGAAQLNVRSGPGATFNSIAVLNGGDTVQMVGRSRANSWIQVRLTDGRMGWVNQRYLISNHDYNTLRVTG
ncbi:MAG: PA14 domain-containing protein [Caldilineaceae bacterium]